MTNQFFEKPILNSPYAYPTGHWELDDSEQLEAGDALDSTFREIAGDEIERFRREIVESSGDARVFVMRMPRRRKLPWTLTGFRALTISAYTVVGLSLNSQTSTKSNRISKPKVEQEFCQMIEQVCHAVVKIADKTATNQFDFLSHDAANGREKT